MKTLQQKYLNYDGTAAFTVTHIYSERGHFERNGHACGWHIQLGTNDRADNYTEVEDGSTHEVPASLPDIILPEPEPDPAEEATVSDYQDALTEMGVNIDEEE